MPRDDYWRRRAEEARQRAASRATPAERQADINAAEAYDALAEMNEGGRQGSQGSGKAVRVTAARPQTTRPGTKRD